MRDVLLNVALIADDLKILKKTLRRREKRNLKSFIIILDVLLFCKLFQKYACLCHYKYNNTMKVFVGKVYAARAATIKSFIR